MQRIPNSMLENLKEQVNKENFEQYSKQSVSQKLGRAVLHPLVYINELLEDFAAGFGIDTINRDDNNSQNEW